MPLARADLPPGACRLLQVGGSAGEVLADFETALEAGQVVVVSCAEGQALAAARETLARVDTALRPRALRHGAWLSRSATDGMAALAAWRGGPIGVDVQVVPGNLDDALLAASLGAAEREWFASVGAGAAVFARLWAGKEAVLKALGVGLAWPPAEVMVSGQGSAWRRVEVGPVGSAWLIDLAAPCALAVAVKCRDE